MYLTSESFLFIGSILVFTGILISKAGNRFGLPSLLLFLVAGMLFGHDGLGIEFDNARQTQFAGMVALCIILFTGGLETKVKEIKPVLGPGLCLSTLGVILTTVLTGLFIYGLSQWDKIHFSLPLVTCILLAATMSSTDSASVFNLLRGQNIYLKNNLKPILELESGSNDPMAYILTIVLIEIAGDINGAEASVDTWHVILNALKVLMMQFVIGGIAGFVTGKATVWFINRINLNNTPLYAILLLSIVFFSFSITGTLNGNGYLAVYIAGIIIGNHKITNRKEIFNFLDGMTWMMQIGMFLLLGLLVNPKEMLSVAPMGLLIGAFMMLVARPASVFISLIPFRKINLRSKTYISWVGLRGAVPIIFATYPVVAGIEGSDQIFNIVFFITLLSLIIQGSTITSVAKMLKLDEPAPEENDLFGIEVPEEAGKLAEITLTEDSLLKGNTLKELKLPKGMLVMMIKRDSKFIVPNGSVKLQVGDRLLIISDNVNDC
ncbi:MAG: potassium/proton antiporter [Candidatus Cryptobacteroides sp.]